MKDNSIILLISKIQNIYIKEIDVYLNSIKKQRTLKFYKLIVSAKNEQQLDKSLLFRKLFNKLKSVCNPVIIHVFKLTKLFFSKTDLNSVVG